MIKKTMKKLYRKVKMISTFNGVGSTSEGLKQLGIDTDIHTICEIDESANKTYFKNFPENEDRLVEDIIDLEQNIHKGLKLDLLIQTPACQSFSIAGLKQGFESDNGNLFKTAIDLQKKVDSTVIIYENVKGLISHDKKKGEYESLINKEYDGKKKTIGHTLHIIETLLIQDKRYNYYWKIINSSDQGLPQNRERIFIIGIKKEFDRGFTFPENRNIEFTVEDILEKDVDHSYFYNNKENHKLILTNQVRRENKIHTVGKYEDTMTYESTRRVYTSYVSPCITTGNNSKFMIDGKIRKLTSTELKRIHGFGEDYEFVGSKTQQFKQLGNTVSPGVYKNLFIEIFNSTSLDTPVNNTDYKPKRGRKPKKTIISNNHINVVKKITNNPDLDYLNLTQPRYQEYKTHLKNGGTISMTVEFYKNKDDKKIGNIQKKIIVNITDLEKLGFRDKKNRIYRCKITGSYNHVQKTGKRDVLFTRPGGKGKFEEKFEMVHTHLGVDKKKVDTVIDGFFGGGGFTLKNIEKLNFNRYIINDLDPLIIKTMRGIKKNPQLVIEKYQKINEEYQKMIPDELREYKKISGRKDKELKELRLKHNKVKEFYQDLLTQLDREEELDIYTVSGIYIFISQKTTSGFFKYDEDGTISKVNFNHHYDLNDKTKMIKHWSYLLNRYNVEIRNEDIFELVNDKSISNDTLIYLDPPYIGVGYVYNKDNSDHFQIRLLNQTERFKYRVYSNEDCEELYDLGIDKHFSYVLKFERNNKLGSSSKGGFEFLGCSINDSQHKFEVNNPNYQPNIKQAA